ncbi:MAG: bifunctional tetrahydrofolate synthase/dihydrofolate synthase [Buchnera aphidicola (Eriosoma harunire)]
MYNITITNKYKTLSDWLIYLEKKCRYVVTKNLYNVKLIANILNLSLITSFVFIVTGTNGKGSTCRVLEQLLLSSGYTVGLYTSPHLFVYSERVRINGKSILDIQHCNAFSLIEKVSHNIELTYFEFITLASLWIFKSNHLDVLILEVGLGGRLDATNVINADIAIITNVYKDHMHVLGQTVEEIGYEKSGVFRNHKIAFFGDRCVPNTVFKAIERKKVMLKLFGHDWDFKISNSSSWDFVSPSFCLYDLPIPLLTLENVAIAMAVISFSGFIVSEETIRKVIKTVTLTGRFQIVFNNPLVIFDVCHNPSAANHLSKKILKLKNKNKVLVVIGVLKDKDIVGILKPFIKLVNFWFCSSLKHDRTMLGMDLMKLLPVDKRICCNSISDAFISCWSYHNYDDIILVFGSFVTVSEVFLFIKSSCLFQMLT